MIRNYIITAIRHLTKNLTHTSINVIGLSIGLTCSLLIVMWVINERSYDTFHHQSQRLFRVLSNVTPSTGAIQTHTVAQRTLHESIPANIPEIEAITQVFTSDRWPNQLCFKRNKKSIDVCAYQNGIYADDNFFSTFTFNIIRGNPVPFSSPESIAISESMAKTVFPNTDPIGQSLIIDDWAEVKVSAIFANVPNNSSLTFDFVMPFTVFRKLRGLQQEEYWQSQFFETYIRTGHDVETSALTEKINGAGILTPELKEASVTLFVQSFTDQHLFGKFENGTVAGGKITYVKIFGIIAILITLMACINFINLATARAATRSKEVGVRKTTGANRSHLVIQFMSESFIVVLIALIIAIAFVQLSLPLFNTVTGETLSLDLTQGVLPYWIAGTLLIVSLLAGVYPAIVLSSFNPVQALKSKMRDITSGVSLRRALTVIQLAASVVMIVFTVVLFMQLNMIQHRNLGFDKENIIRIEPTFNLLKKFDAFKTELLKHATIEQAGVANGDLLNVSFGTDKVSWPGKADQDKIIFKGLPCGEEFLETMNVSIQEGRTFTKQDTGIMKAILTEEAVKQMQLKDPIGARITIFDTPAEVIGVTSDIHGQSLHRAIEPTIFIYDSKPERLTAIYVRYQPGTTDESFKTIASIYNQFEPDFSMKYWFMDENFAKQYKSEMITGNLTIVFTIIALSIAMLGIVGLTTYNVLRRIREIGIRKVFGASSLNILTLLSKELVVLVVIATVIAWPVSWYISATWLESFAYHISIPWWAFLSSFLVVLTVTMLLIGSQGIKAAITNPSKILRYE